MNQLPKLMTVSEFAQALGVTKACIRRWVLERRVTTTRLGRLVRIPAAEAARLIEAGMRPADRGKWNGKK